MKRQQKSALNRMRGLLFVVFFLLGGCADTSLPSWISGEPGPEKLEVTRLSHKPQPLKNDDSWPSLADVPTKKPAFTAPAVLEERARILEKENERAQKEATRLMNVAVPETLGGAQTSKADTRVPEARVVPSFREKIQNFFALKP